MVPQDNHNRLLLKEAQNIRQRHPERSRCPMDPDTEFRNSQNYVCGGFQLCWGYLYDK